MVGGGKLAQSQLVNTSGMAARKVQQNYSNIHIPQNSSSLPPSAVPHKIVTSQSAMGHQSKPGNHSSMSQNPNAYQYSQQPHHTTGSTHVRGGSNPGTRNSRQIPTNNLNRSYESNQIQQKLAGANSAGQKGTKVMGSGQHNYSHNSYGIDNGRPTQGDEKNATWGNNNLNNTTISVLEAARISNINGGGAPNWNKKKNSHPTTLGNVPNSLSKFPQQSHQPNGQFDYNMKMTPSKGNGMYQRESGQHPQFDGSHQGWNNDGGSRPDDPKKNSYHRPQQSNFMGNSTGQNLIMNQNLKGQNTHGANTGGTVQVSEGGTLLIGPGGRPKTSSGKHQSIHGSGPGMISGQANNNNNSRLSHYSAGQNTGNATKTNNQAYNMNSSKGQQMRGGKLGPSSKNQAYPGHHQRAVSTQENYPGMQTGFQGMHQNHQMRRSMDNYIQLQNFNNPQMPFQQSAHLNSSNFNNNMNSKMNPTFGRSQVLGGPSGSMDKLSKQQQQQTPSQINNTKKIRRKRDFSQVIDPSQNQKSSTQQTGAQGNNSHTNSPSKVSGNKLNQTGPHQNQLDFTHPRQQHHLQQRQLYRRFLEGNNQTIQNDSMTPNETSMNNHLPKQFNTIQTSTNLESKVPRSQHSIHSEDDPKNKVINKLNKKTHLRSLTSHKGALEGEGENTLLARNNPPRRQPSASGKQPLKVNQSKGDPKMDPNETIPQEDSHNQNFKSSDFEGQFLPATTGSKNGQKTQVLGQNNSSLNTMHPRGAHSEDRNPSSSNPQHQTLQPKDTPMQSNSVMGNYHPQPKKQLSTKAGNNPSHNVRASISKEVSTSSNQQTVQPRQTNKKFDNCVTKFAFATKTGYSPKNPNKVNQDSFLVLPHLGEYRRTHFFAVADGHGVNGKLVSEYVKTVLAKEVEHSIKYTFDQAKINQRVVDSTEVKEQLEKSFGRVTDGLFNQSGINLRFSGSTCVSVLIVGNKVFCANVGDSRATLARRKEYAGPNGVTQYKIIGIPLNRDHKADEPDEQARILQSGGRVAAYRDMQGNPLGPARVWHLNEDIPGLAMSRSFGDQAATEVGVNSNPEITEMNLVEADKFLILASDGVWEFISNDQAVNIVMPHYQNNSAEKAAEALIREAMKRWQEEDTSIDDITCIIIFLNIQ